jgi:hypothetical protein
MHVLTTFNAGQEEFTERDVEVFKRYLTFCGIGMHTLYYSDITWCDEMKELSGN